MRARHVVGPVLAIMLTSAAAQDADPVRLSVTTRLQLVGGDACERVQTRGQWWASEAGVEACLGLGCVEDRNHADSEIGYCARPRIPNDCAGLAYQDSTCGVAPKSHLVPEVRAVRSLATANSMLLSDTPGRWGIKPEGMVGGYYQISLGKSRAHRGPDGIWTHTGVPSTMLHLGAHATAGGRQLIGGEVGLVKLDERSLLGLLPLTRVATFGIGQWHADGSLDDDASFRLGPGAHAEIKHNLIAKVGYMWNLSGPGDGAILAGLEYGKFLRDDLWLSSD